MDREKLRQRIEDADIPGEDRQNLLLRLKVASHEGCAAVVRDFEAAMVRRRKQVLQSHRRFWEGRNPSPNDKRMIVMAVK